MSETTKPRSVTLDKEVDKKLVKVADDLGISVSKVVNEAVKRHLSDFVNPETGKNPFGETIYPEWLNLSYYIEKAQENIEKKKEKSKTK